METKDILNYCESLKALGSSASAFENEIQTTKDILATEVICLASLNKTKENDVLLQSKEIQEWIVNSENKTSFLFRRLLEMASRDSSPEKYVEGFANIKKLLKSKIAKGYTPEVILKNEVRMSESYLITGKNTWLNIFNGVYDEEWIEFLNNIGLKVPSSVVESYGRPELPTFAVTNSISLLGLNKILQRVGIEKDGIFLKEVVRKGRFDVLDMLVQQKHQCVKNLVSESLEWVGSLHGKSFIEHYKYFIEKYSVIICLAYEGDSPIKNRL